jgi:putative acetyltransferase
VDGWIKAKVDPQDHVVVAEQGTEVVGFGERNGSHVIAVYVRPTHARQGIGSAILHALERTALVRGYSRLHVSSSVNAELFYAHHRFIVESRGMHRLSNGTDVPCVRMIKSLMPDP